MVRTIRPEWRTAALWSRRDRPEPASSGPLVRANGGCTDTDNNSTGFSIGAPAPRNYLSALNPWGVTPAPESRALASLGFTRRRKAQAMRSIDTGHGFDGVLVCGCCTTARRTRRTSCACPLGVRFGIGWVLQGRSFADSQLGGHGRRELFHHLCVPWPILPRFVGDAS